MRIGLVTCLRLPEPDPDHPLLVEALTRRGHTPVSIPWDGPDQRYDTDVNLLRSPWNYYEASEAFLSWIERIASRRPLINPPEVIRWNIHKHYLAVLQQRSVPIVPTKWFSREEHVDLAALMQESAWDRVVIKPAISAASFRTRSFGQGEVIEAQKFVSQLVAERDVLVQKYMDGFADPGERSLIWIAGEWTHAVRKRPRFDCQIERVEADSPPQPLEIRLAEAAIESQKHRLTYGRVDVIADERGRHLVSEVELIEPSLFFTHGPAHALERLIDRIETF